MSPSVLRHNSQSSATAAAITAAGSNYSPANPYSPTNPLAGLYSPKAVHVPMAAAHLPPGEQQAMQQHFQQQHLQQQHALGAQLHQSPGGYMAGGAIQAQLAAPIMGEIQQQAPPPGESLYYFEDP